MQSTKEQPTCLQLKQDITPTLEQTDFIIKAGSDIIKITHQVCYDVMVTFHMFPHTDSLET